MIRRLAGFVASVVVVASATAQTSQFEFDPTKVPVGTAMHYRKTNLDGSHATRISIYVADRERLESLKWNDGGSTATLVQARMDWRRFSVAEFKSWHLARGEPPALRGTLRASADGRELEVSFAANQSLKVDRWPWHSYDFDFASLGLTLPHLRDPELDVIFWRTDVVFAGEGLDFAQIGGVRLHLESLERRNDRQVRRYTIGGAGLEHRYGKLWTDAQSGLLLEYEIPIGDEPGYRDVRLRLDRMEPMTLEQWQAFTRSRIGEKP